VNTNMRCPVRRAAMPTVVLCGAGEVLAARRAYQTRPIQASYGPVKPRAVLLAAIAQMRSSRQAR
jgi:hypothetical protein